MGTNYYAIPKATDERKAEICEHLNKGDFERARELMPEKIHLGKSSGGWKFCFNHNKWRYYKNIPDLRAFTKTCSIVDEYGSSVADEDFWRLVEQKQKTGIDGKEYYTNWDKYNKDWQTGKPLSKPAYIPSDYGEIEEGEYRYSTSTEFC